MWPSDSLVPVGPIWGLGAGADSPTAAAGWVSTAPFSSPVFFPLSDRGVRSQGVPCALCVWLMTAVSSASAGAEFCHLLRTTCKESTNSELQWAKVL